MLRLCMVKLKKKFDTYDEAKALKKELNHKGRSAWIDIEKDKKYSVNYYKV